MLKIRIIHEQPANETKIKTIELMEKGDAQKINWQVGDSLTPCLLLSCYKCGYVAFTSGHTHTWNEDGTVTLNPSIVCPEEKCDAHYWIRNNEIFL